MKPDTDLLKLPTPALYCLVSGVTFCLVCLGVNFIRASNIALKWADKQMVINNTADKLEDSANKLKKQAELIEQKDTAYKKLEAVYEQSLKGQEGYGRLQSAIESIKDTPRVEDIEVIHNEISDTEEYLIEATKE